MIVGGVLSFSLLPGSSFLTFRRIFILPSSLVDYLSNLLT